MYAHTHGTITNSDLELAAIVIGSALAARDDPLAYDSILLASDNTPAVAWATKGSTTSAAPNAFLLHQLARQRQTWRYSLSPCFTPCSTNKIADACSRCFHLSDSDFLNFINTAYPVQPCWRLAHLPSELISNVNSNLFRQLQPLALENPDATPATQPGIYGTTSASNYAAIHICPTWTTPSLCSKFLHTDTGPASWLPVGLKSALEQWREPFVPWGRRLPHWDITTHA